MSKKLTNLYRSIVCAGLCVLGIGNASATLLDRGPDMVYDDVLNITWTRNANLSGVFQDWTGARTWANNLVLGGYDDWRLPWGSVSKHGGYTNEVWNCFTSPSLCADNEMGYMFYNNLGGIYQESEMGTQAALGGEVLTGIEQYYWSGTEHSVSWAWFFRFSDGYQFPLGESGGAAAWAVRDGDVTSPLPEPETYAMLLAGLGLLGFAVQRRKRKESAAG